MRNHRNPRQRLPKRPSADNFAHRSLLRKHGVELAHKVVRNANAALALNVILDVLRKVDQRHAMRLIEALAAFVTFATTNAKRARKS